MSSGVRHVVTVLLIDDQRMIAEAVRRMLMGEDGIVLHHCQDPTQALETANRLRPTVILQDLVMPGTDGLDLVQAFRAQPETRDVPLIVLSTKEEPEVKVRAFALGANDYLVKLPDRLELVARIRYHSQAYETMLQLERHSKFIRDTFGRYLSDEVVERLLDTPGGLRLGGEALRVTIMFADLRGFTALIESQPPDNVVAILNNYLEVMTEVIFAAGGTIEELMGDGILTVFGAPVTREDDAERAVACALAMQLAMPRVNQKNRDQGLPELEMGIALHTGDVVAGNIGSKRRAKYGVVGTPVNLAARIESYTVGGQILVSEATRAACQVELRIDGELEVEAKGMTRSIRVYDIGGIGGRRSLELVRRRAETRALAEPVPVLFTLLAGKRPLHGAGLMGGQLLRLGDDEAELRAEAPVAPLSDLRLELGEGAPQLPFYGKVLPRYAVEVGAVALRFTSIPEEVESWLRARAQHVPPG